MKRFLMLWLLAWLALPVQAEWLPTKSNRLVNDYSGMLTPKQSSDLEHRLEAFNDSTSNQILVVITPTLGGDDANAAAQRLGERWGVGQADLDNGVVILIKSKTHDEPEGAVAIATGYGIEGALPDLFCRRIIDNEMLPALGNGDYYQALCRALDIIQPVMAGEYSFDQYRKGERRASWMAAILILLCFVGGTVALILYAHKHPDQWNKGGGGFLMGGSTDGWLNGNHPGGGHSGGGFGGFGGGSFGGGGASGRF